MPLLRALDCGGRSHICLDNKRRLQEGGREMVLETYFVAISGDLFIVCFPDYPPSPPVFLSSLQGEFCSINQKLFRKRMQTKQNKTQKATEPIPCWLHLTPLVRFLFPCILLSDHRRGAFVLASRKQASVSSRKP